MIWKKIADFILKNRPGILVVVMLASIFMGYQASKVRITFNGGKVLPVTDSAYVRYNQFKKLFGQDATTMVFGFKSPKIFDKDVYNDWHTIAKNIKAIKGVSGVISITNVYDLVKDTLQRKYVLQPLTPNLLTSDKQADSVKQKFLSLPFYKGLVLSEDGQSTLMAVTFDGKI